MSDYFDVGPKLSLRPARQGDLPDNPWRSMDRAPKDCTWVEVRVDTGTVSTVYVAHWAQDLSGEEQPPFSGWFINHPSGGYAGIPNPFCWRPLIP